jgi:hypothetical protein
VGLQVFQDVSNSNSDPSAQTTQVLVFFDTFDTCNFVDVASAEGQVVGADVQGDNQLNTASVNATVPMTGTGVPDGFTLTISVTWQGVGVTSKEVETFMFHSLGRHSVTSTSATQRDAIATGTITDGTTNYASAAALDANLFDSSSHQIVIDHS